MFFIAIIVSRFIVINALKQLTNEEKAKLLSTNMINSSQTRLLLVLGVLGIYYFAFVKYPQYAKELLVGFVIVVIISRVAAFVTTRRKLAAYSLPQSYIRAFAISSLMYNIGIPVFFIILMQSFL